MESYKTKNLNLTVRRLVYEDTSSAEERKDDRKKGKERNIFPISKEISEEPALSMETRATMEEAKQKEEMERKRKENERKMIEEEMRRQQDLVFNTQGNRRRNSGIMRTLPKESGNTPYHTPMGGKEMGTSIPTKEVRVELERIPILDLPCVPASLLVARMVGSGVAI